MNAISQSINNNYYEYLNEWNKDWLAIDNYKNDLIVYYNIILLLQLNNNTIFYIIYFN
jgi:hypothetical protein